MLLALVLAATAVASPIPLDRAQRVFEEVRLASDSDGAKLWGVPLYGPILLVDPATRFAVANVRDAEGKLTPSGGVFSGTLPESVILANTATEWSGTRWTMVLWTAVPERSVPMRRLLLHECWHRIQNDIGLTSHEKPNPHLDSADGRYWLQLELRALAVALQSGEEARRKAAGDALTFRARRRRAAGISESERLLENNEGLAEYTGWALRGTTDAESQRAFAQRLATLDRESSFGRSFAYLTGPAYGLLLDSLSPGWTRTFKHSDDLGDRLAAAAKLTIDAAAADAAGSGYHAQELRAFEEQRATERKRIIAGYQRRFVEGPVLTLPMADAHFGFNPNAVTTFEGGTVHASLDVTAGWGTLSAIGGVLIPSDFSGFVVPAPSHAGDASTIRGDGWTLVLAPGWKITPGTRPGDYRVTPAQR